MSAFNEIDVTCEECGEMFKGTVWTAVHAQQDPELKDLLLGGELNILMCPKCSHASYQDHFVLYQDPVSELVAYIYPPSEQANEALLKATTQSSFEEAQAIYPPHSRKDYAPLLVFGLEGFVELMHEEESRGEQSQVAEAVCLDRRIAFLKLRPSHARALGIARVLPGADSERTLSRAALLRGLEALLGADPALSWYATFKNMVAADPAWTLSKSSS